MADPTSTILSEIESAQSLDAIRSAVRQLSAAATGSGGILYSGNVGPIKAKQIAIQLAKSSGLSIINNTARAQFLVENQTEVLDSTILIFKAQGLSVYP